MIQRLFICVYGLEPTTSPRRTVDAFGHYFGSRRIATSERADLSALQEADVIVALIDSTWFSITDAGVPCLNDPSNRIAAALINASQSGKLIIPALLGDVTMPEAEDLPDALRFLHYQHALTIRDGSPLARDALQACSEIESIARGHFLGAHAGSATFMLAGWLALLAAVAAIRPLLFSMNSVPAWLSQLGSGVPPFDHPQLVSTVACVPIAVVCAVFGVQLLQVKRRLPAWLLLLCAVALAEETYRPLAPVVYQPPLRDLSGIVDLMTRTVIPYAVVVALATLAFVALRPSTLTYSRRVLEAQRRNAMRQALAAAPGIYVSCLPEDRTESYVRLLDALKSTPIFGNSQAPIHPRSPDASEEERAAALEQSDVVLVMIGRHWGSAADETGRRHIDNPEHATRREIAHALALRKRVIPILIDGAAMPRQTPAELAPLCFIPPMRIRGARDHARELDAKLSRHIFGHTPRPGERLLTAIESVLFPFSPRLFITYRRSEDVTMAERVTRAMRRRSRVGPHVFRDTDAVAAGTHLPMIVLAALSKSNSVAVLIGPDWLSCVNAAAMRRLDIPTDLARHEIATALREGKPVVPVLFGGARMPTADELPEDIAALARETPVEIGDNLTFTQDMARLYDRLRRPIGLRQYPPLMYAAMATMALWGATWLTYRRHIQAVTVYLLSLRPSWNLTVPHQRAELVLPYLLASDPNAVKAIEIMAAIATLMTVALFLVAAALMCLAGQMRWLIGVSGLLTLGSVPLLGVIAAYYGLLPATLSLSQVGATITFAPLDWLRLSAACAPLLLAVLTRYFWRSKGRPLHVAPPTPVDGAPIEAEVGVLAVQRPAR